MFSGSVAGIPDGTYRIVGIEYKYADGGVTNEVVCTLILDTQFKFYLNLNRIFTDTISEVQAVVQDQIKNLGSVEVGKAVTVAGGVVSVTTENGNTKFGRDPTV